MNVSTTSGLDMNATVMTNNNCDTMTGAINSYNL